MVDDRWHDIFRLRISIDHETGIALADRWVSARYL
jgi:hypothetical protein